MAALVTKQSVDATGNSFPVQFLDINGNGTALSFVYSVTNANGVIITPAQSTDISLVVNALGSPLQTNGVVRVITVGSTGFDLSVNKPSLPNVAANFANSGIYANYVLVGTAQANAARNLIDVENTSGAQIILVRDDGTAANGSSPNNASVIPLAGGIAVGAQGSSWNSSTFKGRLQIYSANSSAFVTIFQE